ncbi:Phosphatidylinositol 4-kinase beta 1 [Bienertia sinuspersici]
MVRLLGITIGEPDEFPREITRTNPITSSESVGENGWLIRFFDSAFFCEWIAVSYLYKHEHSGVRDYLCNRMYTLPLSGIESYLFQICYMMVHKPSPSLDKFVIDVASKSLKIALKVHWFLMAEIEDSDDNEGISRIQEKCQIGATLMGEWPPLIRPPNEGVGVGVGSGGKNQMLNKLLSSKQRLLSLTSSPPMQKSFTFSPSSGSNVGDEIGKTSPDENNKIFKKFMPGPKVRDALLFRKSSEKEDDDTEKDGFFRRLLRDSKDEDEDLTASSEGFFKRLFRDSKSDSEDRSVSRSIDDDEKENFFRKIIKEVFDDKKDGNERHDEEDKEGSRKSVDDEEKEGFFRKIFKDKFEDKKDGNEDDDKNCSKLVKDEDKDGFFRKFFKEKVDDKKDGTERKYDEDDEKEGFFRKFFKEKFEEKKNASDSLNDEDKIRANVDDEEPSEFPLFRRLFRVHPEEAKNTAIDANALEGSPGTENFFRKLFRDRDRSVEDSELFGLKKRNPGSIGSPSQPNQKPNPKPPLPNGAASQFRKGAYHESLDFVHALCETSFGLVDVFPVEDRKCALRESLTEINSHVAEAQTSGGVCFPMGKGVYRVLNIPEDEAVLLNSREKAPYLICVEVLKCDSPSYVKDTSNSQKLSKGGIPLANGDALLPKPPPWAYPLGTVQEAYCNDDRMSKSTSQVIDRAMGQFKDAKVKFVSVSLSVEDQCCDQPFLGENTSLRVVQHMDLEYVRVVLTTDPRLRLDDIEDQAPPRRKEHRRVPSMVAMEEVKAAAAKGQSPLGLPLKGAGQESSDAQSKATNGGPPKPTDPLSGELWEVKKDRIRQASVYGKLPGWDLRSVIVKSGDDCRQEHLSVQLISHFYDIFQEAGLPLWLRPYEVLVTSSYTALIETIPDTASIHSIKSRYPNVTSLRDFFNAKYQENSPSFKLAQVN